MNNDKSFDSITKEINCFSKKEVVELIECGISYYKKLSYNTEKELLDILNLVNLYLKDKNNAFDKYKAFNISNDRRGTLFSNFFYSLKDYLFYKLYFTENMQEEYYKKQVILFLIEMVESKFNNNEDIMKDFFDLTFNKIQEIKIKKSQIQEFNNLSKSDKILSCINEILYNSCIYFDGSRDNSFHIKNNNLENCFFNLPFIKNQHLLKICGFNNSTYFIDSDMNIIDDSKIIYYNNKRSLMNMLAVLHVLLLKNYFTEYNYSSALNIEDLKNIINGKKADLARMKDIEFFISTIEDLSKS